jgi:hypothetical protein
VEGNIGQLIRGREHGECTAHESEHRLFNR